MLKKRITFFVIICLLASIQKLKAQEQPAVFSADTAKFIGELTVHFRNTGEADAAEAKLALAAFSSQWNSNAMKLAQKKQAKSVCVAMNEEKLQVAPYFVLYFKILTRLINQNAVSGTFDLFHKSVNYCLNSKSASRVLLKYLTQTELLLRSNAFMQTNTEAWFVRKGTYKFAFDTVPYFSFSSGNLACIVRNDSSCVFETRGSYYPLSQIWYGKGGKVNWERTGLGRDVVFAKLAAYQIDTRTISFSADSVLLYHGGYFKKFLLGKYEDKAMVDFSADKATFPKFTIYKGTQVYINLFKNIEFFGGFNLEGSKVIGTPVNDGFSRIEIKHDNKPFITFKSTEFVIRPDRFVSSHTQAIIYIENDSIYHPGVQVRYNLANNELVMNRGDEGLSQSPFFNTYHKLDMFNGAIYWKLNEEKMDFEELKGINTKSEAVFESSDYFSLYRFDKMQGVDEVNPAMLVSVYVRKLNIDRFYAEDYATWAKKPVEQIKVQLIKLANAGFLSYDVSHSFAVVHPRLNEFLAARSGVKDSDIIQFQSFVEKGVNAQLDLKSLRLTLNGIKQVILSDSQYVYVIPRDGKVIINKNRDFSFNGRVHAGLFDFIANECTFNYDKFSLSIPKIDTASMIMPAWNADANGDRPFVKVKSVIAGINGELFIDSPDSKSGRKMLHNFPKFISKDTSYVYFDRYDIANGAYKRKNFYFMINPFEMDSVNSLPPGGLRFEGRLVSAGIFPDLYETIRVQKDYSLGFKQFLPEPGLPIYGGRGVFSDTISLSNKGLRGSGTLTYLTSVLKSNDILFTPDRATATVKNYALAKVEGDDKFPDAKVDEAQINWTPGNDLMTVQNFKKDSISMFDNKAKLNGMLYVSPEGLKGAGQLTFENAEVNSKTFRFNTNSFTSDTSDFKLLTDDHKKDVLRVHAFKTSIDFTSRQGHFVSTGENVLMELPFIKYKCVVGEFDWLMDQKQLQLINKTSFTRDRYYQMKPAELLAFNPGKEVYTSTDPKQDSLSFFALQATYDLDSNYLEAKDVRILKIADAAIFPFNATLSIGENGRIKELKQAEILANRTSLFHKFYNANVNITSSKRYVANGLYDYIPADGEIFTLEMDNIAVNNKGETFAGTSINDSSNFMLNRYFRFKGKIEVNASSNLIYFEGGYGFTHDCSNLANEWIKLRSQLDPKKILIPVTGVPENTGDGKLRTSIYYSLTENTVKPGFFAKAENITDPDIISASGFLTYDSKKSGYLIGDTAKLDNSQISGDILRLNTKTCNLSGDGQLKIASNLGRLKLKSAGNITYYSVVDSTSLEVMSALDFFFSDDAMKILASALNASEAKGLDVAGIRNAKLLREFAGKSEADKIITELSGYGQFKKFPEVLNHTMVLSDLQLTWNKDLRSYISKGTIGISNLGAIPVNKKVNGYLEIGKRRSGDIINIYLAPDENQWYFFTYANGTMQVLSTNKDFNDKLVGLKESERVLKGEKGEPSYQFIIGTGEKKAIFLRKMKQAKGED